MSSHPHAQDVLAGGKHGRLNRYEIVYDASYVYAVRMLSIRLDPDTEKRLAELAAKTGRTKSYYAREAILEHLDEMEDRYIAIERLEHPAKRWSLEELERDADLGG